MTLKSDLTPTQYSYDQVIFEKDGSAKVRVQLYNASGGELDNKWINLDLSQAVKDTVISKVVAKVESIASSNNFTKKVKEEEE